MKKFLGYIVIGVFIFAELAVAYAGLMALLWVARELWRSGR